METAAKNGDLQKMIQLVEDGEYTAEEVINPWHSETGDTLCHTAAGRGRLEVLQWLHGQGADIYAKNNGGRTPCHDAAMGDREGCLEVLKWLHEKGADINVKDKWGSTPYDDARGDEVEQWLKEKVAGLDGSEEKAEDEEKKAATTPRIEDLIPAIMEGMLEKFVSGTGVWLQPVTFPNPEKKFHYYMMVKPKGKKGPHVLCLRHGADAIVTESLETEALRNELLATAQSNGVKVNSDHKDFKKIEDDRVRALFEEALEEASVDPFQAFQEACKKGDLPLIGKWLEKGVDVNTYNALTLHEAIERDDEAGKPVVEFLLSKGADVHEKNSWDETAVSRAAANGFIQIAQLLIASGADLEAPDQYGKTPIHFAGHNLREAMVAFLVDNGAKIDAPDKKGMAASHKACMYGRKEMLICLLANGASVTFVDANGWTPLHHAAAEGNQEIAESLVANGSVIDARDNNEKTPLYLAASNSRPGSVKTVEFLIANGADPKAQAKNGTSIQEVAEYTCQDEVVAILEKINSTVKADVDAPAEEEKKVKKPKTEEEVEEEEDKLHEAAQDGSTEQIKALIADGVDVNATQYGKTPLAHATANGHTEAAQVLIDNGADVKAEDRKGETPLHGAAFKGSTETMKALITRGANVNAKMTVGVWCGGEKVDDGRTPLFYAAWEGHTEAAQILIDNGADVNVKYGANGTAPLHWAAEYGHPKTCEVLINNGADVHAENIYGDTPLHLVADVVTLQKGHTEAAQVLITKGSDLKAKNKNDQTPLDKARSDDMRQVLS